MIFDQIVAGWLADEIRIAINRIAFNHLLTDDQLFACVYAQMPFVSFDQVFSVRRGVLL